jgi:hypothetical protein
MRSTILFASHKEEPIVRIEPFDRAAPVLASLV